MAEEAAAPPRVYTAAAAFFEAIWDAGIRYCFVNLGSDHPAILEAITYGQRYLQDRFPRIITCPHEMVAMSMADGYARRTGRPQAVIVHVDVGTQALGQAFHNASSGRAPVLVFAGAAPFTQEGELRGSRSEFIHWLQDVPDQRAIVAQYCRYAAEVRTGRNVQQMVRRALQFATSDPKGPVYLMAPREVLEEEIAPYTIPQAVWTPIAPAALPATAVTDIAEALANATRPLIVVGFVGRNHGAAQDLVRIADRIPHVRVYDAGMSDMSFPANHPAWITPTTGAKAAIEAADAILVVDADVPWIPAATKLQENVQLYHVDVDPLKQQMQMFYIPAIARYRASSAEALAQLSAYLGSHSSSISPSTMEQRRHERETAWKNNLATIAQRAAPPSSPSAPISTSYLAHCLKHACPPETIWASEAVTNHVRMADQLQAVLPGSFITKGGSGLGWNGGAGLGIWLAATDASSGSAPFVAMITGDGSFMFGAPACAAWVAARYAIPILTIVLDNGGWRAPRHSAAHVWPQGLSQAASAEELNIGFGPHPPRYGAILEAGSDGWIEKRRVDHWEHVPDTLQEAVAIVQGGRGCVVEVKIE